MAGEAESMRQREAKMQIDWSKAHGPEAGLETGPYTHHLMSKGSQFNGNYKVVPISNASYHKKRGWEALGSGTKAEMEGMKEDWDAWHQNRMDRWRAGQ